jgi:hypothetical protein
MRPYRLLAEPVLNDAAAGESDMIIDHELVLSNIRFLAKPGALPELYEILRARLSVQEEAWGNQQLTEDELFILSAKKRRILSEIDYVQSLATPDVAATIQPAPEPPADPVLDAPDEPDALPSDGAIVPV